MLFTWVRSKVIGGQNRKYRQVDERNSWLNLNKLDSWKAPKRIYLDNKVRDERLGGVVWVDASHPLWIVAPKSANLTLNRRIARIYRWICKEIKRKSIKGKIDMDRLSWVCSGRNQCPISWSKANQRVLTIEWRR